MIIAIACVVGYLFFTFIGLSLIITHEVMHLRKYQNASLHSTFYIMLLFMFIPGINMILSGITFCEVLSELAETSLSKKLEQLARRGL